MYVNPSSSHKHSIQAVSNSSLGSSKAGAMMSTPTPASRRPRPPSSIAKSRLSSSTSSAGSGPSEATNTSTSPFSPGKDTQRGPFSFTQRRNVARSSLSRVSASPGDVGNVSLGLDLHSSRTSSAPSPTARSTQDLSSIPSAVSTHNPHVDDTAQPSPPPPYGQELPNPSPIPKSAVTPPRQDSTGHSDSETIDSEARMDLEDRLRARRAAEAAKAIGLDMDFGVSNSGGDDDSELEEDEEELRNRLRSVRRRLRQRDKADQALRQHEQVLSQLSSSAKSHLPQLLTLLAVAPAARARSSSRPPSQSGTHLSDKVSPPSSRFRHSGSHSIASISSILSPTFGRHSPTVDTAENSPDRPGNFRLVHGQPAYHRRASRPRAFHPNVPSPTQRYHLLQAEEAEQRIIALEAALMEAQAGEENQRKAVARMRRDHDKTKRDLERAEGMLSETQAISGLPRVQATRGKAREENARAAPERQRSWYDPQQDYEQEAEMVEEVLDRSADDGDWRRRGSTPASSRPRIGRRVTGSDRPQENTPSVPRRSTATPSLHPRVEPKVSSASTGGLEVRLPTETKKARKPLSLSSFLSPTKAPIAPKPPLTPSLHVQSPDALDPVPSDIPTRDSTLRARPRPRFNSRSPTQSPQSPSAGPVRTSPSPARSLASIASTLAQSPGFTSISNRMATMRDFVADSLFLAPSTRMTRTLGSELGSEFGDDWEGPAWTRSMSLERESPMRPPSIRSDSQEEGPSQDVQEADEEWEDEPETGSGEDETDHTTVFNSPAALPPLASAALSSLALALAPTDMWDNPSASTSAPILPRGCLRDRRVDGRAYELLGEAVKGRRIIWADSESASSDLAQFSGPRVVRPRRPSSPSPRPSYQKVLGLGQGVSRSTTPGMEMAWEAGAREESENSDEADWSNASSIALSSARANVSGRLQGNVRASDPRSSLGVAQRPAMERAGSSQSSVALAHRRVSNQPYPGTFDLEVDTPAGSRYQKLASGEKERAVLGGEPTTIPGKLVHDILVWSLILLEWMECLAILAIKVMIDLRRGRDGVLARQLRIQASRRRRYYL